MKEISKEGIDNRSIYKSSTAKITVIQGDFNCILHFTLQPVIRIAKIKKGINPATFSMRTN